MSKRKYTEADYDRFVAVWIEMYKRKYGKEWVADQLGLKPGQVSHIANTLRVAGVELPRINYRVSYLDQDTVSKLNAKIKRR